ncbi:MAG: hypothetical protein R3F14_46595 [Polyangiaceae bacterium]
MAGEVEVDLAAMASSLKSFTLLPLVTGMPGMPSYSPALPCWPFET